MERFADGNLENVCFLVTNVTYSILFFFSKKKLRGNRENNVDFFQNTISVHLLSSFYGAMEIERHPELLSQQLLSKNISETGNVLWCHSEEATHH